MRPYLRVANVFEDRIDTTDVMEMNFTPEEFETYRLHHGDILLNEGQSLELVGRPAMFRGELDGVCFTNSLVRYQAGAPLVQEFALYQFRYWLRSGDFSAIANITTNIAHLGAGRFAELKIALPPVPEQRRIVAKLDELLARSRRAREELAEVPALLARYRESVLAAAFRGDLTADWREAHPEAEPASDVGSWERKRGRAHIGALLQADEELPRTWQSVWLGQAATLQVGYAFKSSEFETSGLRLLRGINIEPGAARWTDTVYIKPQRREEFQEYGLKEGDVVIAMDRPIISSGIKVACLSATDVPALLLQRVGRFRLRSSLSPQFLLLFLNSRSFRDRLEDRATGTQLPHVSAADIESARVALPPLAEQREIVRRIEAAFARINAIEAAVAAQRAALDAYDRALLARAFAGELVPQDPADEPAAALLARLRAERDEAPPTRGRRRRT